MSTIQAKNITGDTLPDRLLRAWLSHDLDALAESDKTILTRITELDKQWQAKVLVKGNKKDFSRPMRLKELVAWHVERFKVSQRQAYADIELAKQFFLSSETRQDKEFARGQMIHQGEELMFEAAACGDFKAASAFFKELRLLRGLDKIDAQTADLSAWEPITPVVITSAAELGFDKIEHPDQEMKKLLKSFNTVPNDV